MIKILHILVFQHPNHTRNVDVAENLVT